MEQIIQGNNITARETASEEWDLVIKPKSSIFQLKLGEVWRYRDLLFLMVRRDFVAIYKQTILGPLWFFVQPLLTTAMYMLIFGKVAQLKTDNIPALIFYLAGVTCWSYFSETLLKTSDTFISNASIFGKVYFPRLIIPLSIIVSSLIRFAIQLSLFLVVWVYYLSADAETIHITWAISLFPLLLLLMALLGLGCGIIISSMTTKYRDLRFLLNFGIQLLMFATPIVYPLSIAPEKYRWLIEINPFTSIIETFRYGFLGSGSFSWLSLAYTATVCIVLLFVGMLMFNRVEKNFMDTV